MNKINIPKSGDKITMMDRKLNVPDNPIIPFIEGDGIGPDIWAAAVRVLDAAVEKSYGDTKKIHPKEIGIRKWALRSLVTLRSMKSGEIIGERDIWSKRPGTGIPSHRMAEVVGKRLIRDIPDNEMLDWTDLADNNSKK